MEQVETVTGHKKFNLGRDLMKQVGDREGYFMVRDEVAQMFRNLNDRMSRDFGNNPTVNMVPYHMSGNSIPRYCTVLLFKKHLRIGCCDFDLANQKKLRTWTGVVRKPRMRSKNGTGTNTTGTDNKRHGQRQSRS